MLACDIIHEHHDGDAEDCPEQGDPFVEVSEAGAPAGGLVDAGVEDGVVDDGVGADKEVGEEARDLGNDSNHSLMKQFSLSYLSFVGFLG